MLSPPLINSDVESRGSSVSSTLQDEYDELLRYAVVMPSPGTQSRLEFNGFPDKLGSDPKTVSEIRSKPLCEIKDSGDTSMEIITPVNDQCVNTEGITSVITQVSLVSGTNKPSALDSDVTIMERAWNNISINLKDQVLTEFIRIKKGMITRHEAEISDVQKECKKEIQLMHNELDAMKELVYQYEAANKKKDQQIANLTDGLQKQKAKFKAMQQFSAWKVEALNATRERFTDAMADKFYRSQLRVRVWRSWRQMIESRWRERIDHACQQKAVDVCTKLANDYDLKLQNMESKLQTADLNIQRMQHEKEQNEEEFRKAFLRGVSALNMEAMNVFNEPHPPSEAFEELSSRGFSQISGTVETENDIVFRDVYRPPALKSFSQTKPPSSSRRHDHSVPSVVVERHIPPKNPPSTKKVGHVVPSTRKPQGGSLSARSGGSSSVNTVKVVN